MIRILRYIFRLDILIRYSIIGSFYFGCFHGISQSNTEVKIITSHPELKLFGAPQWRLYVKGYYIQATKVHPNQFLTKPASHNFYYKRRDGVYVDRKTRNRVQSITQSKKYIPNRYFEFKKVNNLEIHNNEIEINWENDRLSGIYNPENGKIVCLATDGDNIQKVNLALKENSEYKRKSGFIKKWEKTTFQYWVIESVADSLYANGILYGNLIQLYIKRHLSTNEALFKKKLDRYVYQISLNL